MINRNESRLIAKERRNLANRQNRQPQKKTKNNAPQRGPAYYVLKLPPGMLPALLILPWMVGAVRRQWRSVAPWVVAAATGHR